MKRKAKLILAATAGGILLGAVAYLFTSDKSGELRKKVRERSRTLINDLGDVIREVKQQCEPVS